MNARKLLSAAKAVEAAYIEDVFSTYLYTGTGSPQTITNEIDLAGKGGLVWIKMRSVAAYEHILTDTARGAQLFLSSDNTVAQQTGTNDLTAFTSTGFSLGSSSRVNRSVASENQFASWTFRKQANFFDVVTFTTDSGGQASNISHSLGSVPGCILIKRTSGAQDWKVYHRSLTVPTGRYLELNSTVAEVNPSETWISVTSTTIGFPGTRLDGSSNYVAYLFAHDAGGFGASGSDNVISCGSYTTDGSGNATVNLGWEPQFVISKQNASGPNWIMADVMRGAPVGSQGKRLNPNTANAEDSSDVFKPNATGFTVYDTPSVTSIYIAIRRGPMKTPTTGTSVYNPIARSGNSTATTVTGVGFAPDLIFEAPRTNSGGNNWIWFDRLRGGAQILSSDNTGAEVTNSAVIQSDSLSTTMDGFRIQTANPINASGNTYVYYPLRRAPGFFDVVCYTGGGFVNETIAHNLTVVPEFVIIKRRDTTELWWVNAIFGSTTFLQGSLNTTDFLPATTYSFSGFAKPTATSLVFNSGNSSMHASGSTYVAYLFATCPGVSKVGSYTGTGNTLQIDCGFTGGARFVLIKRTDSAGDWYVWDSARGIVAGNDPYLLLNSTAAEVTTTDWVDTHSPGFELSSAVGNNANISTASYIFLAIA